MCQWKVNMFKKASGEVVVVLNKTEIGLKLEYSLSLSETQILHMTYNMYMCFVWSGVLLNTHMHACTHTHIQACAHSHTFRHACTHTHTHTVHLLQLHLNQFHKHKNIQEQMLLAYTENADLHLSLFSHSSDFQHMHQHFQLQQRCKTPQVLIRQIGLTSCMNRIWEVSTWLSCHFVCFVFEGIFCLFVHVLFVFERLPVTLICSVFWWGRQSI